MKEGELNELYREYHTLKSEMDKVFKIQDVNKGQKFQPKVLSLEKFDEYNRLGTLLLENIDELDFLDVSEKYDLRSRHQIEK